MRRAVTDPPALGCIHVHVARVPQDPLALRRAARLLSADELERLQGIRLTVDRARFASAHALLRRAIALHTGESPSAVAIEQRCRSCDGNHGPPRISDGARGADLHVSLAHCTDIALCAVARGASVGVDVEPADRAIEPSKLSVALTARERARLRKLPPAAARTELLRGWVRKEAYAKGRGLGLALRFRGVEALGAFGEAALVAAGGDDGEVERWSLRDLRIDGWVAAVAHRAPIEKIDLRVHPGH